MGQVAQTARTLNRSIVRLAMVALIAMGCSEAQSAVRDAQDQAQTAPATTVEAPVTDADKIADASRAAPTELVAAATFLDWPSEAGGDFRVLREGTNGWICIPDYPGDPYDEPHCLDEEWLDFIKAYMAGTAPATERIGLAYMLNSRWAASNNDVAASERTADNQWHEGGSHLMLIVPDPAMLDWFTTEPTPEGGAYVMWAGTEYAHLMIPIPEAHANDE